MSLPEAILNVVERALVKPPRYVYRSAKSGRFVTKAFAEAHPESTIKQRIANKD